MTVYVIWSCICDLCNRESITVHNSDFFLDEMADAPEGWKYCFNIPEEYRIHWTNDCCLACPECQLDPNWDDYQMNQKRQFSRAVEAVTALDES